MRSALRWLARLGLGLVLLAAVVVAMLLITAHTGWGREHESDASAIKKRHIAGIEQELDPQLVAIKLNRLR